MTLRIITADERLSAKRKINVAIFGPSGVGKTFQAATLDPATTLFVDFEAGTLALQEWRGDVISVREEAAKAGVHPWEFARALACLLCGADPAADASSPYGATALGTYIAAIGERVMFDKYQTVFVDSITVASRMAFSWSQRQPQAFSDKTGKPDNRGAYGLLGQEMVTWLTQLQHVSDKNIIVVGILDATEDKDIPGRVTYEPQIEGSKAGRELPGIFDQVLTLGLFTVDANGAAVLDLKKGSHRGFVCHQVNGYGVPAKDRSGRLLLIEPPDLGALLNKISTAPRIDALNTNAPAAAAQQQGAV